MSDQPAAVCSTNLAKPDQKPCPVCNGDPEASFYCGECGRSGLDAKERCKHCGEAITHWMGCDACGKEVV